MIRILSLVCLGLVLQRPPLPPGKPQVGKSGALPTVVWTNLATQAVTPGWNAYTSLHYDPTSQQVLAYLIDGDTSGIYSTGMFAYRTSTNVWTRLGGTHTLSSTCNDGSASTVQPWPPDRHPVQQMAVDTLRKRLWLINGVCNTVDRNDFWFYSLNADPTLNRWTSVPLPVVPGVRVSGGLVYDPDTDALLLTGGNSTSSFHETWIYCPAAALSSAQTAAGCGVPQTWTQLAPAVQPGPAFSQFPNTRYDAGRRKLVHFGWNVSEIWDYDVPTRTWTERTPASRPANNDGCCPEQLWAYLSSGALAGKFLYHQTSHQTVPRASMDWLYDPATALFTPLMSTGVGPDRLAYVTWDAAAEKLIAESYVGIDDPVGRSNFWMAGLQ